MSEESIFSQTEASEVEQQNPAPQITLPQEVADLVGEGRKYKSVEDALRSVPHAQSHIHKLEEEMQTMRDELTRRKTAEELLEEFRVPEPREVTPQPGLDPQSLAALVDRTLDQREAKKKQQDNTLTVVKSFNEKFGEKAPEVYEKIAADNGLSVQFLNSVAAASPAAVLKLAGIEVQKQAAPYRPTGSVNTEALSQTTNHAAPSAKLPKAATTKDLVNAWRNAGDAVRKELGIN
jgi:vacuolar-type H+-ATPase subunit I/STV1